MEPSRRRLARGCLQPDGDSLELSEGGGQVLNDLTSDDLRSRQVVEVFERLVTQPREVEVDLVAATTSS
jgi:hypothetical protein